MLLLFMMSLLLLHKVQCSKVQYIYISDRRLEAPDYYMFEWNIVNDILKIINNLEVILLPCVISFCEKGGGGYRNQIFT